MRIINRLKTSSAMGLAIAAAAAVVVPQSAMAQEQEEQANSTTDALTGNIIVTARKREEDLQDTPIAISAFSTESLEARGVVSTDSLATITPNLTLQNNPAFGGSSNSAAIYIRGIGQQDFVPTVDPGVGVYVDGVYIARSVGGILDLVDFERIEVLRGPQGTLFGRNTIGGAISITSAAPSDFFEGKVSAAYGTDDYVALKGSVNVPLSDAVAFRASGAYFGQDGYVERPFDGLDLGDANRFVGRFALRAEPSDTVKLDFAFDYTHARENGPPVTLLGINFGNTLAAPPFVDINNVLANLAAGAVPPGQPPFPCATPANPVNLAVDGCFDERFVVGQGANLGTAPSFSDSDIWGGSLTAEIELTDSITLKSITAYRNLDSQFARDGDASPITISQFFDDLQQEQFSQEIQILGTGFDGRLEWILGGYYFDESGDNVNLLDFTVSSFRSGGAFSNESIAAFAQATFEFSDVFSLTGGIRYTEDTKSFRPDQVILQNVVPFLPPFDAPIFAEGTPILPNVTATRTFDDFTPMVNLAFQPNSDLLLYATFSQGFKSGGFTQRVFPPILPGITTPITDPELAIPSFDPEEVTSYELGVKYTTPDGLLRANLAAFLNDYTDLQIQVFTSVAPVFQNAASATVQGLEGEFQLSPGDGWFAEFSFGLTDASYDDIDFATTFVNPDNEFERISKWTLSGGIQREFEFSSGASITPRVDWSYRSRFFNDTFNTPEIAQDGYHLVDANITFRSADGGLSVTGSVTNIFDQDFLLSGVLGDAFQTFESVFNRGRQFRLTVTKEF